MFEREVYTEVEIDAPPAAVWSVLADLGTWSQWNPVVHGVELHGPLAEGTRGTLSLNLGGPVGVRKLGVVMETVRENEELAWRGGPQWLMSGCHRFALHAMDSGTRLVHTEVFSGPLAPPIVRLMHGQLHKGYRRLNHGLRARCEG